ncbi:hypothetical protein PsorP6_018140 [Peronosclerospora sorghi]|uniref:Uncharacterized protein n=1 Tax=Peronosclerospora sorghi TaxID=230839 RepID=A0ACC0WBY9_9STRA|nr:hypothetical protein PsorP6_018140 [Peronosclerospora sorghi]
MEKDRRKGIFTVEQNLNRIAHFERMKALFGENPAVQPLLIVDSLAAPANSNDEDEEATGEVDVHHDETQLGDKMGSPARPLEGPPGPGQEKGVRNSPPRDVADDVPPLPSPLPEPLLMPGQKRKAPPGGKTKDKRKAPPSLQNASMQCQKFVTALKEVAQEKALAIREADDKRLQWEKEKWEDDKRERERERRKKERLHGLQRGRRESTDGLWKGGKGAQVGVGRTGIGVAQERCGKGNCAGSFEAGEECGGNRKNPQFSEILSQSIPLLSSSQTMFTALGGTLWHNL